LNEYSQERRVGRDVETTIFQYVVAFVFLWLLSGFWQLQIQDPELYAERAAMNRIRSLPILAPRGKIVDRDGRVVVDNWPAFKVMLSRNQLDVDHLPLVAEGLQIPYDRLQGRLKELEDSPDYQRVILKDNLAHQEVAFIEAHRAELSELELLRSPRRLYPQQGLAAHVTGYVGEISEQELEAEEFVLYEPGAEIGKAGIERQYNDALSGADGSRMVLVDSRSRRVRDLDVVEAKAGRTIRLTLDLDLQAVAELALEGRRGGVVALDPRNGEVLAMASAPSYDLNRFVGGISPDDWRDVVNDPDKPLLNRPIQAQLAPGSIFKPIVAWAALAEGVVDPGFQVHCGGGASFYGRYFRCHRAGGHGWVDLEAAMAKSCDVYFYNLGKDLGIDRIAKYAELAGLGKATGIDLPNEKEGVVPSAGWKARFFRDRWYAGETISVSIGQGALTMTPLQAAHSIGGLAVGGVWHRPHLLPYDELEALYPGAKRPEPRRAEVRPADLRAIERGMWGVVNSGEGTGGRAQLKTVEVCGKTGSAQRVSRSFAANSDDPRLLDDAWFVGFAPCRDPEIVVAALYENGEHGYLAAPIVRDVIKAYFDKRQRVEWASGSQPAAERPPSAPALAEDLR